jgi:hypothetical protein
MHPTVRELTLLTFFSVFLCGLAISRLPRRCSQRSPAGLESLLSRSRVSGDRPGPQYVSAIRPSASTENWPTRCPLIEVNRLSVLHCGNACF